MAIHISFHDQGLIEVNVINNELTSLKIYDREKPYGSELTFYFNNPLEVAEWANKIWAKAHNVNKLHTLNKIGV